METKEFRRERRKAKYPAMLSLLKAFRDNTGVFGCISEEGITVHSGGRSLQYIVPGKRVDFDDWCMLRYVQGDDRYRIKSVSEYNIIGEGFDNHKKVVISLVEGMGEVTE